MTHVRTSPFYPQSNGLRFILHLLQTVRTVVVEAAAFCEFDSLCSARRIGFARF